MQFSYSMKNFVKFATKLTSKFNLYVVQNVVWGTNIPNSIIKITNVTYMLVQKQGFGCTNIVQLNYQSHICEEYKRIKTSL